MIYETKDSGTRQDYPTGARRDTSAGKPRYDLIPETSLLRLAELMARGAEKYGEHNWKKGIPTDRYYESAYRHLISWRLNAEGDNEDHLAAVVFNIFAIMYNEDVLKT